LRRPARGCIIISMPRTKIICTLGPASESRSVLLKMMRAGMDVVRLNFSHGRLDECLARIRVVRELNQKYRRRIRILGDLEGFRIRVGRFPNSHPITVKKRQTVWLVQAETAGGLGVIPFDYHGPLNVIAPGQFIYIDDGNISLRVEGREKKRLKATVIAAGVIKERKGINIPDVRLPFTGLTERDKAHIRFCAEHGVDFIAQSFVRTARDIRAIREFQKDCAHRCRLIAKIENREGIKNIDSIIAASDGIMIARGDMGVSLPVYEVPVIQKIIIRKCNRAKKPVITATQMLESMTESIRPTRAEVSDVANAIIDGTDFVMLSAESAVGQYPVETVAMMNNIIKFTEAYLKT